MASLYSNHPDVFIAWVDTATDMVAQDIDDLFDALLAVETEIGDAASGQARGQPWPASGTMGTIVGRLFGRKIWSKKDGHWISVEHYLRTNQAALEFDEQGGGKAHEFNGARFLHIEDFWQPKAPVAFCALQGPFTGTLISDLTHYGKGRPWHVICVRLVGGEPQLVEEKAWFVARDGGSGQGGANGELGISRLFSGNSRNDCKMGLLFWGLVT